jgi:uncharacterized protein YndB with AHSA1/START domain
MFKKILIGLAVIIAILVVVIAMQPADFKIERSTTIKAPPASVFALVNDFHKWEVWSPWAKLDPNMKATYEGPAAGPGAKYSWVGDSKVGEGRMTIEDSRPPELVKIRLEFLKPFAATSDTEFNFKPEGNGTKVTWTMSGKNGFMPKAFGLFMNMDKMVGGDFEKGLAQMKFAAEAVPNP